MPPVNTAPSQKSPYDFLDNEPHKQKRSLILSGFSFRKKLLVLVGSAVAVLIVLALVVNMLLPSGGGSIEQLREIAKQQNELMRIADMGAQKSRSSNAMNLAVTTKATLISDQKATLAYLTAQKQKISPKELSESRNSKTDDLFRRAEQANQFDDVFTTTMQTELKKYQTTVKKAYDEASGKKAKAVLADNFNHIAPLLGTSQ